MALLTQPTIPSILSRVRTELEERQRRFAENPSASAWIALLRAMTTYQQVFQVRYGSGSPGESQRILDYWRADNGRVDNFINTFVTNEMRDVEVQ